LGPFLDDFPPFVLFEIYNTIVEAFSNLSLVNIAEPLSSNETVLFGAIAKLLKVLFRTPLKWTL